MRLKVVVVDLELPPRFKKWALRIGAAATLLFGAGAIAWAAGVHTWNQGDTLNATDLNGSFTALQDQLTALQSAPITVGAYITDSAGGASIGYQSGSWIQSVSRTAAGSITITLVPSFFSANAPCTVTPNSTSAFATLPSVVTNTIIVNLQSPSGAAVDANFMIICSQTRG
jgi:hypothetical protein